jgi:serine protease Do
MRKHKMTMKLGFVVTLVAAASLIATAEPSAAGGWPEPHSGAYLGVHIEQVSQQTASNLKLSEASGALITYVDQDGPACKAGLKNNDVIVGFNGSKVQNPDQLSDLIHATAAGKSVKLTVLRDSQKKDIDVTLGAWPHAVVRAQNLPPVPYMGFAPPSIKVPDIDVPTFNMLTSRHGVVVESLCPQLSDYFGVPRGQGVLVRSVEKGSPAEAAGLKAGDVITKVNNETVHDMADWRHAMQARSGKLQVSVVRDKREQTVVLNLPESHDTSELQEQDWPGFADQMEAFQQEMDKLGPELARSQTEMMAAMQPSEQELEQMRQNIERSMKLQQKDIEKMQKQIQKEVQKSIPSQQELQKQIEKSMKLQQKDLEKMRINIQAAMPTQQQLDEIRRQVDESMKNLTPQLQQQMEQIKKQMEEQKLNLQEMVKGFQNEF